MEKEKVYFIKDITSDNLVKIFDKVENVLKGNIAIKVHSGEKGNQNYLLPEFFVPIVDKVKGTIVESNTAYPGARNTTKAHKELLELHQWSKFFNTDILDAEGPDLILDIPEGKVIKQNYVGKNILKYDSMLVLSHFKGHPGAGYGGALKQLSIGCASSAGKAWIHSAGATKDVEKVWNMKINQEAFLEAMADSASSIVKHFAGNIVYINVMCNMSVDCDCCEIDEDPCMKDIGILASLDPIALDQACIDLIKQSEDIGKEHLLERINSRNGLHTIESALNLNIGTDNYELISI